jgi:transcriptional regulator with XRE-family HTH domain
MYPTEVSPIEQQLLEEIGQVMRSKGISQADYAKKRGVKPQSVSQFFTGRKALLTGTARDLLEFLGVRVRLEIIETPRGEIHASSNLEGKFSMENSDLDQLEGLVKKLRVRAQRLGDKIKANPENKE